MDNAKDIDIVMPMYKLMEYIVMVILKHLEVCGNL